MHAHEPQFTITRHYITFTQADLSRTNRFDLCSGEHNTRFVLLFDEVFVIGFTIGCNNLDVVHRLAPGIRVSGMRAAIPLP
ncbi:MAG: hypothetical protein BWY63_03763 [Chloroflexi bacterium ADurb.Bin360]|nr:MAG: hypothetical protein BWY63_03763 [Chloroflexi bacterium ADurb.Bin360]